MAGLRLNPAARGVTYIGEFDRHSFMFTTSRNPDEVAAATSGAAAAVLVAIIVGMLYFGREVFVPIALAILLSFVLAPPFACFSNGISRASCRWSALSLLPSCSFPASAG